MLYVLGQPMRAFFACVELEYKAYAAPLRKTTPRALQPDGCSVC